MAELSEWIINSPYTEDDCRHILETQEARRRSGRFVDSREHGNWLKDKALSFMKGTWLEQDLVPWTLSQSGFCQFGFGSGPIYSFENAALHEVAHAIQLKKKDYANRIKKERFQQPKSSTQTVMGQTYYEPLTMEVALCEAEANGIQLVLLEMLGYEINKPLYYEEWAHVARHLPDRVNGGKQREEIISKAIEMYYLVWNSQKHMMEHRYNNFCKYVGKFLAIEPGVFCNGSRLPTKAA